MSDEIVYRFPECNDWKEEVMRQWNGLSRVTEALYRKPAPGEILTIETSKKLDKIQGGLGGERRILKKKNVVMQYSLKKDLKEVKDEKEKREECDVDDGECEILSEHELWTEIEGCP